MINSIDAFLKITNVLERLPNVDESYPFGFVNRGRGGMTFLNTRRPIEFMAFVEFTSEGGPRGRHKHLKRQECLYIVSGRLQATYWLEQEHEAQTFTHDPGTLIIIEPGLYHTYECIDGPALAFEFSTQIYDRYDYYYPPHASS